MLIGFVYDLREDYLARGFGEEATAEFDSPETIEAVSAALERNGHRVERVGPGTALAARLVAGARFDLVFSIAEGLKGRAREAQVPALCELFDQPYALSDPLTMAATLDKAAAKALVRDAGVATAPFAVIEPGAAALPPSFGFPVFVKPVAEGTGKGCGAASLARNPRALAAAAKALAARFQQPAIVEPFLPGREFTVGIVGNGASAEIIAVMEIVVNTERDGGLYSFENKELCEERVIYRLADDAEAARAGATALAAYRVLGCRDAARIDLRSDAAGEPQFLEANPIAGMHPTHSDLPILASLAGRSHDWLVGAIVDAAARRLGLGRDAGRNAPASAEAA